MICLPLESRGRLKIVADWLFWKKYAILSRSTIFVAALFAVSSGIQAGEYRHHGVHEHGVANLNVAIEGNNVYIEFFSPAANIVGFEHHPRTQKQKDAVRAAVKKMQEGHALFILPAGSKSRLAKARVDTDIENHADHLSESEYAHEGEEHHRKGDNHDREHNDADDHARHSEFTAEYHFVCKKPNKLSQIDVQLFRVFPGIEYIEVQLINETRQTAVELTARQNKISL